MHSVTNKRIVYFDCDDTLVMWGMASDERAKEFTIPAEHTDRANPTERLVPHEGHVRELKRYHEAGWAVVVWSAGGGDWAATVVKGLGLEAYVTVAMGKPQALFDDLNPIEWLPTRDYLLDLE